MSRRHRRKKQWRRSAFPWILEEAGIRVKTAGDLIYVYLESPEAVKLAPQFLPPTQRGIAPDGSEVWVYRDADKGAV
jgi:hypothetical protein